MLHSRSLTDPEQAAITEGMSEFRLKGFYPRAAHLFGKIAER